MKSLFKSEYDTRRVIGRGYDMTETYKDGKLIGRIGKKYSELEVIEFDHVCIYYPNGTEDYVCLEDCILIEE